MPCRYVDALSSNVVGLMGEPLEFTSATEFDSATISFTIDQSQLGDTAFDNLMILWYNEEEGIFEEMPTDRDISLEIERNRKYLDKIMVRPPSADDKDVFDQITATMKSAEGSMRWDLSNCIDTFVNRSRADYRALP